MAECECGHDHEEITIVVPGSEYGRKWNNYRVEIETIVVKTYASLDERRLDRRRPVRGPLWENPNNLLQLIKPLRWRIYYLPPSVNETVRPSGHVEMAYHGAATIQGAQYIQSRAEAGRVWAGLVLLKAVEAQSGGAGRKPGHETTLAHLDRRICEILDQDRKAHRPSRITYTLLVRFQSYSESTAFNVLKDEGHTTLASRVAYLKKAFTK